VAGGIASFGARVASVVTTQLQVNDKPYWLAAAARGPLSRSVSQEPGALKLATQTKSRLRHVACGKDGTSLERTLPTNKPSILQAVVTSTACQDSGGFGGGCALSLDATWLANDCKLMGSVFPTADCNPCHALILSTMIAPN